LPPDQSLQRLEACRFTRSGAAPKQQQSQVHNAVVAVNYPAPVIRNTEGATVLAMMRHPPVSQSIPDELVNTIAATQGCDITSLIVCYCGRAAKSFRIIGRKRLVP
jgi:hypothetical protein